MNIRRAIVAAAAMLAAMSAGAADVTGTWALTVETQMGSGNPTMTLKQDGENVTGTYKGQMGETALTGTVKGDQLSLSYTVNAQGMELKVSYVGTTDGTTMSGKASYGDMGEGTFKGTKQ